MGYAIFETGKKDKCGLQNKAEVINELINQI